jgi:acetyl-CoA acyltransferase 1
MSVQASTSAAKARVLSKSDDDIVIVSAVRSAITKVRLNVIVLVYEQI